MTDPTNRPRTDKPGIDKKDLAAATAVGAASRVGTSLFRQRKRGGEIAAGAGASQTAPAASIVRQRREATTAVVVAGIVVAMVVLMVYLAGR